jgi:hypothetical protein
LRCWGRGAGVWHPNLRGGDEGQQVVLVPLAELFSLRCLFNVEHIEKINGSYDADRPKRFESQQIEVVRDDEVRVAGESAGEDVVIGRVFLDNVWWS